MYYYILSTQFVLQQRLTAEGRWHLKYSLCVFMVQVVVDMSLYVFGQVCRTISISHWKKLTQWYKLLFKNSDMSSVTPMFCCCKEEATLLFSQSSLLR